MSLRWLSFKSNCSHAGFSIFQQLFRFSFFRKPQKAILWDFFPWFVVSPVLLLLLILKTNYFGHFLLRQSQEQWGLSKVRERFCQQLCSSYSYRSYSNLIGIYIFLWITLPPCCLALETCTHSISWVCSRHFDVFWPVFYADWILQFFW